MSQQSHRSDPRILNRRTLQRDHPYLARVLRPGMDILDVGCGTGAITADIAKAVGPDGTALGIDRDDANLAGAVQQYGGMENLRFEGADILTLGDTFDSRFDIVTAARTIHAATDLPTYLRKILVIPTSPNRAGRDVSIYEPYTLRKLALNDLTGIRYASSPYFGF